MATKTQVTFWIETPSLRKIDRARKLLGLSRATFLRTSGVEKSDSVLKAKGAK